MATDNKWAYQPLDQKAEEIRLIDLLPGEPDDAIRICIFHEMLLPSTPKKEPKEPSLGQIQGSLPGDWRVSKTISGRYLFMSFGEADEPNSWTHPDPEFDNSILVTDEELEIEYSPRYEALSYTWGDYWKDPMTAYITSDSGLWNTAKVDIGQNLASALRHLRYKDKPRTLWVDALCINQQDLIERNHQVKQMGNIYRLAYRVIAWVGESSCDSELALETLNFLDKQVEVTTNFFFGDAPGAMEISWWKPAWKLPYDDATWSALTAFFRRPWFHRVWTLQETHLGNKKSIVQCGSSAVSVDAVRKAVFVFNNKSCPRDLINEIYDLGFGPADGVGARSERVFQSAWSRQCKDPRDKIYGVLTLVSPTISRRIEPQYSMPHADIYKDAMVASIEGSRHLALIQYSGMGHRCGNAPTWVPNFTTPANCSLLRYQRHSSKHEPAGATISYAQYIAPDVLEVLGTRHGRVSFVSKPSHGSINDALPIIRCWEPEGLERRDYAGGGTLLDAFLDMLVQGQVRDKINRYWYAPCLSEIRTQYQAIMSGTFKGPILQQYEKLSHLDNVSMITTTEGYIGVAPGYARPGK